MSQEPPITAEQVPTKCPVCVKPFNDNHRLPLSPACGHTTCATCLRDLTLQCHPEARPCQEGQVPGGQEVPCPACDAPVLTDHLVINRTVLARVPLSLDDLILYEPPQREDDPRHSDHDPQRRHDDLHEAADDHDEAADDPEKPHDDSDDDPEPGDPEEEPQDDPSDHGEEQPDDQGDPPDDSDHDDHAPSCPRDDPDPESPTEAVPPTRDDLPRAPLGWSLPSPVEMDPNYLGFNPDDHPLYPNDHPNDPVLQQQQAAPPLHGIGWVTAPPPQPPYPASPTHPLPPGPP